MIPTIHSTSGHRSERRIAVHLLLKLSCRDRRGNTLEEITSCENLCRNGAAFMTHLDVEIGSELGMCIPYSYHASRRREPDFETHGRVVHIDKLDSKGEKLVGVQFIGPRFQRVFRSETAA